MPSANNSSKRKTGDRPEVLPAWAKVDAKVLRPLSKVSDARSALTIAGDWLSVLVVATACWHYFHWALYVLAVLFIGARQHDLLVLMHDGAHYRLFKNRKLNDWMSELFLTWPFFVVSTHGYRANHWAHHRHLNTAEDPDLVGKVGPHWTFPMPLPKLIWIIVSDSLGLAQLRTLVIIRRMHKPGATPKEFVRAKIVFCIVLLAGITLAKLWIPFLLFWLVPFLTWTPTVLRLRAVAEHYGIHAALPVGTRTRTVLPNLLDRLFFVNHAVWFHSEHHFYPSVPLHRLGELHAHLMEREEYRNRVHVSRGYWRAFWEVTREGWRGPTEPVPGALDGYSL